MIIIYSEDGISIILHQNQCNNNNNNDNDKNNDNNNLNKLCFF